MSRAGFGYGSGMVPWEMSRLLETIELSTGSGEWFSGNNRSSESEFRKKNRENMSKLFLTSLRLERRSQREESWPPLSSVRSARGRLDLPETGRQTTCRYC